MLKLESFKDSDDDDFDDVEDGSWKVNKISKQTLSSSSEWSSSAEDDSTLFLEESPTTKWMDSTREFLIFGVMYQYGCLAQKISPNEQTAIDHYAKAHELGHPRGSYKMGEIYYDKNIDKAEQYFTTAIRSFLEKVVEKDIYFGETDFEFMFNDFRNAILKFSVFYRIVCQHQNDPYCQKLKAFADSRKDNKLT